MISQRPSQPPITLSIYHMAYMITPLSPPTLTYAPVHRKLRPFCHLSTQCAPMHPGWSHNSLYLILWQFESFPFESFNTDNYSPFALDKVTLIFFTSYVIQGRQRLLGSANKCLTKAEYCMMAAAKYQHTALHIYHYRIITRSQKTILSHYKHSQNPYCHFISRTRHYCHIINTVRNTITTTFPTVKTTISTPWKPSKTDHE